MVWAGEGPSGVNGAGELDEREATGAAGESVVGLADVGYLSVAAEVAADVRVTGATGDAGDKKPAPSLSGNFITHAGNLGWRVCLCTVNKIAKRRMMDFYYSLNIQ